MLRVGVIGAGRAGRARLRALEASARAETAGVVSGQRDAGTHGLEEILADPAVDAVCVCTVNAAHAALVGRALGAGKHVLCEYPLALSYAEGVALFALAGERGRVLHVEHIELLSGSQEALRRAYARLGRPRPAGGTVTSQAGASGWMAVPALAGFPAFAGIARFHRLVDLFGEATVGGASLAQGPDGEHRLVVDLEFAAGGTCRLDYRRGRGLARREDWAVALAGGGALVTEPPVPTGPLFARDLEVFVARVQEGGAPYVSDARVLEVLALAEEVRAACAR